MVSEDADAVTPLPESGMVSVGFAGSLLVIVRLPLAAPVVVGANTTTNVRDAPGGMASETLVKGGAVMGFGSAVTRNVGPEVDREALRVLQVPLLATVMRFPMKKLTSVAPKLTDVGDAVITGGGGAVPVPVRFTVRFCFARSGSSLTTVMVALAAPSVVGAKVTFIGALDIPGTVMLGGDLVNAPPGALIELTVRRAAPEFEMVTFAEGVPHDIGTFPKLSGLGAAAM
jgi:hypothetical protein